VGLKNLRTKLDDIKNHWFKKGNRNHKMGHRWKKDTNKSVKVNKTHANEHNAYIYHRPPVGAFQKLNTSRS